MKKIIFLYPLWSVCDDVFIVFYYRCNDTFKKLIERASIGKRVCIAVKYLNFDELKYPAGILNYRRILSYTMLLHNEVLILQSRRTR